MNTRVNDFNLWTGLTVSNTPRNLLAMGAAATAFAAVLLIGGHFFSDLKILSLPMSASIAAAGVATMILSRLTQHRKLLKVIGVVTLIVGIIALDLAIKHVQSEKACAVTIPSLTLALASPLILIFQKQLSQEEKFDEMLKGIKLKDAIALRQLHHWLKLNDDNLIQLHGRSVTFNNGKKAILDTSRLTLNSPDLVAKNMQIPVNKELEHIETLKDILAEADESLDASKLDDKDFRNGYEIVYLTEETKESKVVGFALYTVKETVVEVGFSLRANVVETDGLAKIITEIRKQHPNKSIVMEISPDDKLYIKQLKDLGFSQALFNSKDSLGNKLVQMTLAAPA